MGPARSDSRTPVEKASLIHETPSSHHHCVLASKTLLATVPLCVSKGTKWAPLPLCQRPSRPSAFRRFLRDNYLVQNSMMMAANLASTKCAVKIFFYFRTGYEMSPPGLLHNPPAGEGKKPDYCSTNRQKSALHYSVNSGQLEPTPEKSASALAGSRMRGLERVARALLPVRPASPEEM